MQRVVKQYSGQGALIFGGNESASVTYRIDEFQDFIPDGLGGELPGLRDKRGFVNHVPPGHPNWHPMAFIQQQPLTLVMDDGRKLKVYLERPDGAVRATGDFF